MDHVLGLARGTVELVQYNPEWAVLFDKEKENILALMNKLSLEISELYHIGSTSIPGMLAKPIIDMLLTVKDKQAFEHMQSTEVQKEFMKTGYHFRDNASNESRIFYAKGSEDRRTHYLHIAIADTAEAINPVRFRNLLRRRSNSRFHNQYAQLKKQLQAKYNGKRGKYTEDKTEFIQHIIKLATEAI